jgi:hypothetical protein
MLHLDNNETIILEVRKHWFVFLWNIVVFKLCVILPLILYFVLYAYVPASAQLLFKVYAAHFIFVYSVWLLLVWVAFAIQWTNYYLDVWYVTQKRIIDVEQKGIFHREISNLRFDKIQDISIEVTGFIATMLNFGDIQVQTAAEDSSDFLMKSARNPERVRKVIFSQHNFEAERPRQVKIEKDKDQTGGGASMIG